MKLDRLLQIDRRIIFILVAVAIMLPLIFPVDLPVGVQPPTQSFFDAVEEIDTGRKSLLIAADYDPQTEAECQPMTVALLRHAFARRLPVLCLSLYVQGTGLVNTAVQQVMQEFNSRATTPADSIVYGRDIVYLGWQPPPVVPILSMGESIVKVFPTDFYGTATDSLVLMKRTKNYDQIGLAAVVSSGSAVGWYVVYAETKFGVKVAAANTAVSAPDNYPYLETKQLSGMMGGMKGAAEYESLVLDRYKVGGKRRAMEGMGAQSAAHLLIMASVILGNVAYFVGRRKSG